MKKSLALPYLVALGAIALPALAAPPPPPPILTSPAPAVSASPADSVPTTAVSPSPAATDTPIPDPFGRIKASPGPGASATPTPPADNRVGITGVWEVQIQRGDKTEYTHFNLKQTQTALTGMYMDHDGKKFPISGSLDGQTVRLVVSLPDGSTILFSAKIDGTTDMLGMLTDAKENVPFTAAYRPKEKWIENINAQPGGLGGGMGGPGGPGYPPR